MGVGGAEAASSGRVSSLGLLFRTAAPHGPADGRQTDSALYLLLREATRRCKHMESAVQYLAPSKSLESQNS